MRQRAFDLPVRTGFSSADFLVSECNREAFELIERWPDWPSPALVLHGPSGSGKTHLAHLWCERAGAALISGKAVDAAALPDAAALAIDDAEQAQEEPLLHLYNSALERGASLLLTLPGPPASMLIALPDLASRLRALPVAGIAPPDDAVLGAVLLKHFADRQIVVRPGVIAYLIAHIERSFAAAASVAAQLDEAALAAARPITIKLAREVLGASGP
ncbi:MAG TPA: AAA family ATPase [Stellaceae bacterium]|nr:AAA family ATPase [Stellaceae bacterium]